MRTTDWKVYNYRHNYRGKECPYCKENMQYLDDNHDICYNDECDFLPTCRFVDDKELINNAI